MITPHAALTTAEVITRGGWHPRYVQVIAVASAGGYGFGIGRLDAIGPLHSGGHPDDSACFAFGSAAGQDTVTITFDGRSHQVPVGSYGIWAFTGTRADTGGHDVPALAS